MNRRSIIVVLIGMIAALAGFLTAAYLEQKRCAATGGQWRADTSLCQMPDGELAGTATTTDAVIGIFVAVVLCFTLVRLFLFASGQLARPRA